MTNVSNRPGTGFWILGIAALIWNLMGVFAFIAQMNMTPEMLEVLPEAERKLYENVPSWVNIVFAIAVFGGALGSLLLLLKKKIATPVFILSLVAVMIQMMYNLFMSRASEVYGPGAMIMIVMVLFIAIYLVWYSKKSTAKGWLS